MFLTHGRMMQKEKNPNFAGNFKISGEVDNSITIKNKNYANESISIIHADVCALCRMPHISQFA